MVYRLDIILVPLENYLAVILTAERSLRSHMSFPNAYGGRFVVLSTTPSPRTDVGR